MDFFFDAKLRFKQYDCGLFVSSWLILPLLDIYCYLGQWWKCKIFLLVISEHHEQFNQIIV